MPNDRYRLELTRQAAKDLKPLRSWEQRVREELLALETDPQKGRPLKGSLAGARSLEFSLPSGEHRAAYFVITEDRVCLIFAIGHHENFYTEAERRCEALRRSGRV